MTSETRRQLIGEAVNEALRLWSCGAVEEMLARLQRLLDDVHAEPYGEEDSVMLSELHGCITAVRLLVKRMAAAEQQRCWDAILLYTLQLRLNLTTLMRRHGRVELKVL